MDITKAAVEHVFFQCSPLKLHVFRNVIELDFQKETIQKNTESAIWHIKG